MFADESDYCKGCTVKNEKEKVARSCTRCCNCGGEVVNESCTTCGAGYEAE
jgi:hypothetical protein